MSASANDPIDDLAAAYVLGTLSAERRQEVQARIPHDAALRTAIDGWEGRLLPLTALVDAVEPSPNLWMRIETAIAAQERPRTSRAAVVTKSNAWQTWWSSLGFWRALAATGFVAASVVALLPATGLFSTAAPQYMVVLVAPNETAPGWMVQTHGKDALRLVPLGTTAVPDQRSLQFWTKADGWNAPVSLGLVQPGQALEVKVDQLPPLVPNQLFEITLEPANGSPTGRPTGPILYIGRAVRVT
ncbi:anti-sigma factor domain-containing protein [Hydrogenophaga sp.]|uniref:anti-sigma factor n=1 Tax=Hydrogenophaga sp. TaxID=1904254 RepID=UPI00272908BE|nr:anti-sigma factor [Hydrogenophaga sp.]MDO9436424.1 anti-sigma factor [Hydrogenophaga sp.]